MNAQAHSFTMKGIELIQGLKDRKLYGQIFDYAGYQALRQSDSAKGVAKALRLAGIPALSNDADAEDIVDLLLGRYAAQQAAMDRGPISTLIAILVTVIKARRRKSQGAESGRLRVLRLGSPEATPRLVSGVTVIEFIKQRGLYGQLLDYKGYQDMRAARTIEAVEKAAAIEAHTELHSVDQVLEALTKWHQLRVGDLPIDEAADFLDVFFELVDHGPG